MATLDSLQFEMERRVILFKPTTTMPDNTQLGYNADPNIIVTPSTPGEQLLFYSPNNTRYVNYDPSGNTVQEWYKHSQPNGWLPFGGATVGSGTDSSTWQLNQTAEGVVLQDASGNLIVRAYDGSLATITVGNLVINNYTGVLVAKDGVITADPSAGLLKSVAALLLGDDITKNFVIPHNLDTLNHLITIYESTNAIIYPDISIGGFNDTISFLSPPPTGTDHRAVIMGF